MRMTLTEICDVTSGAFWSGDGSSPHAASGNELRVVESVSIDSRRLVPGELFVALHGSRDGHSYLGDAAARGAAAALIDRVDLRSDGFPDPGRFPLVRVADTMAALVSLGRATRERAIGVEVVGITGSVGKTSMKDLAAGALRSRRVVASAESFNNELGVPLTLCRADPTTQVLLVEMGTRHAGDLTRLAEIARPNVGVVTNVGLAHVGEFGTTGAIARAKGELLERLPSSGVAVLNADDEPSRSLHLRTRARVLRFGFVASADVRGSGVTFDHELRPRFRIESPWGTAEVSLRLHGVHHVANALAAVSVAGALGEPVDAIVKGLGEVSAARWRFQVATAPGGFLVINDAYNANPASMKAAIEGLAALDVSGRRFAVLGEMAELGHFAHREHSALGRLVVRCGIDVVVVVGEGARDIATAAREDRGVSEAGLPDVVEVIDSAAALDVLRAKLGPGDAVLVKASRWVALETVAEALVGGGQST